MCVVFISYFLVSVHMEDDFSSFLGVAKGIMKVYSSLFITSLQNVYQGSGFIRFYDLSTDK